MGAGSQNFSLGHSYFPERSSKLRYQNKSKTQKMQWIKANHSGNGEAMVFLQWDSGRETSQAENKKIGAQLCKMKNLYFG